MFNLKSSIESQMAAQSLGVLRGAARAIFTLLCVRVVRGIGASMRKTNQVITVTPKLPHTGKTDTPFSRATNFFKLKSIIRRAGFLLYAITLNANASDSKLPDPLEAGWQDKKVCEKLFEDDNKRILRCSFAPGVGHERHFHISHKKGVRKVKLSTGSNFSSEGVDWHEILNIGESTIVYLIVENKSAHPPLARL